MSTMGTMTVCVCVWQQGWLLTCHWWCLVFCCSRHLMYTSSQLLSYLSSIVDSFAVLNIPISLLFEALCAYRSCISRQQCLHIFDVVHGLVWVCVCAYVVAHVNCINRMFVNAIECKICIIFQLWFAFRRTNKCECSMQTETAKCQTICIYSRLLI